MSINNKNIEKIHIIGGGPAGLAVAYYAKKAGLDFHVYEANDTSGGNCRTIKMGAFRFDTGAHRLHNKIPEITNEFKKLLNSELLLVNAPSQIFLKGKFYEFPLQMGNLLSTLDLRRVIKIIYENLQWRRKQDTTSFSSFATQTYGQTLANLFLLNYSKKLWGIGTENLSSDVAGGRLKGLTLKNFIREMMLGKKAATEHIDGSFYYPKWGIGSVMDGLVNYIGKENISANKQVTSIITTEKSVSKFCLNNVEIIESDYLVNTLPLTLTAKLLDPLPNKEVIESANAIKYRNLILGIVGLSRSQFTPNASIYFPDENVPFTRIYEPKNRSRSMAPINQTSLVIECPCFDNDPIWSMSEANIKDTIEPHLKKLPFYNSSEVNLFRSFKVPYAYPVLEKSKLKIAELLSNYFEGFSNMSMIGRSALFRYTHIHDHMIGAKNLVQSLKSNK
ncbi:MAG: FAD-dependent oxidoreductase [Candidatus Latescibacterota bacterium]|nr:FAD-dependent oxidoreductase [Candidatus Latescibacterota bacterium]